MRKISILGISIFLLHGWNTDAALVQAGFGRFGGTNEDGLLTLNVTPSGFRTAGSGSVLEFQFADPGVKTQVRRVTATDKVLLTTEGGDGAPRSIRYSILYPGFSAEFGNRVRLRIQGAKVKVEEGGGEQALYRWLLITAAEGEAPPVALAFRSRFFPDSVEFSPEGEKSGTLEIGADVSIGEVRFITPLGIDAFPADADGKKWEDLRKVTEVWATIGIPGMQIRLPRYQQEMSEVHVLESYYTSEGESIAPISPALVFAVERGYPAKVEGKVVRTECITKYGPYAFVFGRKLAYTLPMPPLDERGYVRGPDPGTRRELMNRLVSIPEVGAASTATDLAYRGIVSAQLSRPWLDEEKRDAVTQAWDGLLAAAFQIPGMREPDAAPYATPLWRMESEPLTGKGYLTAQGTGDATGAANSIDADEVGLSIYGLVTRMQYEGRWNSAAGLGRNVGDLARSLEVADDWAWMAPAAWTSGISTGSGQDLTAAYAGSVALLQFSRHFGSATIRNQYAATVARLAVPTVTRLWYTEWARERGLIPKNAVVAGFSEFEPFVVAILDAEEGDPLAATGLVSANGALPEPILLYTRYARDALDEFEQEFEAAWGDAVLSPAVVLPHVYTRSMLGEPARALWNRVDTVLGDGSPGEGSWAAPNVIAELLSRETPLILTRWEPATYLDGSMTEDGTAVVLEFDVRTPTVWSMEARVRRPLVPTRVTVDGEISGFEFKEDLLRIASVKKGKFEVRIEFGDEDGGERNTQD